MKTKISFFSLSIILLATGVIGCNDDNTRNKPSFSQIESGFKMIPDSILTSVYWYWVSDNISKEGVIEDLNAMKKVGINRAFIANVAPRGVSYGNVKLFTEEWWEILHTALKTATELNIEIGLFNCPGWSQSGGPWVKKEQSMRYLNSSEIELTGPMEFSSKLPVPNIDFQPVSVIAYKMPAEAGKPYYLMNPEITSDPKTKNIAYIADGNDSKEVSLQTGNDLIIDFVTNEAAIIRSLIIKASEKQTICQGEFLVKDSSGFRSLGQFEINRSNPQISVGFDPYAPIVISVPETRSSHFRLIISNVVMPGGIAEVDISSVPKLERYPEKSLAKMFQKTLPSWKEYLWPVQPDVKDKLLFIDPATVVDITNNRATDGTISWTVPDGKWKIMETGMTSTGQTNGPASQEGRGLETDKMSKKHIEAHFDAYLGEIIRRIPSADRKTWRIVVQDSYESGGQNWTDDLAGIFTETYGYSPLPYLPALKGNVVGSRDQSDRFLWDLRRFIADKVAYDYVGGLRKISNKNGMTTWLENYGHWGFPGEFLQYGGQSDEVAGEFWSEGAAGSIENRAAASCAHIYGKTKVSAESFTSSGKAYSRYPAKMKQRGDRFFTEGINNTLLHVYIHQPDERVPGVNAWFGSEFNRHNTWFGHMDLFTAYLKRTNFMLQQGTYVADVAYFIGEDTPKMIGVCDPELPQGYSFDYINSEVIQTRLSVEDGNLVLPDGLSYRILVLPKLETMRPELLKKIKELVESGAVVLGPAPTFSPSMKDFPNADQEVRKLAAELWGSVDGINLKSARVGKGMILSGMEMQEALNLVGALPDCVFGKNDPALFIHRTMPDGDVYFISNQSDRTITINPEFRITGKSPELWNSVDATTRDLPAFTMKDKTTLVPLKLEAFESQFIVFRKNAGKSGSANVFANFPDGKILIDLNSNWTVAFDQSKRGPVKPVNFQSLSDWTLSDNDSIKYYSGTAMYRTSFEMDNILPGKKIFINLGKLTAMAKVKVNGKDVGGVWTSPYQLDISTAVKSGNNEIEISVVNNWMNRLIGDQQVSEENRPTWSQEIPYNKDSPLQPSGLMGPVRILEISL